MKYGLDSLLHIYIVIGLGYLLLILTYFMSSKVFYQNKTKQNQDQDSVLYQIYEQIVVHYIPFFILYLDRNINLSEDISQNILIYLSLYVILIAECDIDKLKYIYSLY